MSYTANIPVSGDTLGGTRTQVNQNFQNINTAFGVNHTALTTSSDGKHQFLQMPVQGSAPTTAASEGGLYVKDDGGGAAQLFYREESNGTERQLTGGTVAAEGSIELPGGTILKWGYETTPGTSGNITFATPFPNNLFCVTFGISRASSTSAQNVYVNSDGTVSKVQFAYTSTSSNSNFYWQAIGN